MTATDQPQMMPLRVTRNDQIADGIHLLEFRDSGGNPLPLRFYSMPVGGH